MSQNFASIVNGCYFNKEVNGTFEVSRNYRDYSPSDFKSNYAKEGYTGFIRVVMDGRARSVHTTGEPVITSNNSTLSVTDYSNEANEVDLEALDFKIRRRFEVMDILCEGVLRELLALFR